MVRIYRHEVPVDGQWHAFVLQSEPLAVGCRKSDVVEFWVDHHENEAGDAIGDVTRFELMVVGTGQRLPDEATEYVGTAIAPFGTFVWHLIRKAPPTTLEEV